MERQPRGCAKRDVLRWTYDTTADAFNVGLKAAE